ncbi:MAG: 2OG-Fe(II) oxygenase [Myxococcota bacterium]|nr:2OG-Fe(II) oxygenase [Myxococcota bacterium]
MWLRCPARDLTTWAGSLPRLLSGSLRGVILDGLLPPEVALRLVGRLQQDRTLPRIPVGGQLIGESLGLSLDRAVGPHQDDYLSSARTLHERLSTLTTGRSLDTLLAAALSMMARPMPVSLAEARGLPRAPLVFRRLPRGGCIPPHAELEQLARRPYDGFREQLDDTTLLSFFICLQQPASGGVLRVHELSWSDYDRSADRGGHSQPAAQLRGVSHTDRLLKTGSLVVFDGGRWFHEVTPVIGEQERWTAGGFLARRCSGDGVLYWS